MAFEAVNVDRLLARSEISAVDVVRLRDALAHEGPVNEAEAAALLTIELSPMPKAGIWKAFFIDAMTAFAIHDQPPDGYLTADKADWLLRIAAPQGRILTPTLFELLSTILSTARWAPQRLVSALLDEVYCAVASGDGPLRIGRRSAPNVVTEHDVEVVRRILYAAGKSDLRAIHHAEASGLIAIDMAGSKGQVHPAWIDLFCRALVDAAMAASHRTGLPRELFLSPGPLPADRDQFRRLLVAEAVHYRPQTSEDRAIASLERQRLAIVTGDDVEVCAVEWLARMLDPDRPGSEARDMLLGVFQDLAAAVDPRLVPDMPLPGSAIRAA